jgi:hypothetical protein
MRLATDSRLRPTDNEWGVPALPIEGQAVAVHAPVTRWGAVSRSTQGIGTWVFYTDDYRFAAARLAEQVIATNPLGCVEPNYSVYDWTPRAEVLASVYRKRCVAADLIAAGVPVFVDLCMPRDHADLSLLGVPLGWRSYATRGFEVRPSDIRAEFEIARSHAGSHPLFLVYGGGAGVAAVCGELGAVHVRSTRLDG